MAAVVGWALRTPLGARVEDVASRLLAGERGHGAALGQAASSRHARFLARLPLLALDAAHEAARGADLVGGDRVGVFAGVGGLRIDWDELAPILEEQHADGRDAWARGLCRVHPFWMLRNLSNNSHALLAADLGARGDGATFGGATAGAQAIAAASRALAAAAIDAAIVIAYDTLLGPELASAATAPGEAAAALVLGRGPRVLAQVSAASAADGEPGEPCPATLDAVAARAGARDGDHVVRPEQIGAFGAATALVQAIAVGDLLRRRALPTSRAVCLSTGAPGLAAAMIVEAAV